MRNSHSLFSENVDEIWVNKYGNRRRKGRKRKGKELVMYLMNNMENILDLEKGEINPHFTDSI